MSNKELIIEMFKVITFVYVFGALVAMNPNPAEWWAIGRLIALLFVLWALAHVRDHTT